MCCWLLSVLVSLPALGSWCASHWRGIWWSSTLCGIATIAILSTQSWPL
uniref:Uncharacterized protein n=1 Tax=Anguilla anguilla TaxID=7936 RepID=A0A0E9XMD6_ANGAN